LSSLLRILLWPFSLIYGGVTWLRNTLYDTKVFKQTTFDTTKTICVGNLCAGGAGKTPHTEYVLKLLEKEFSMATLSRGYKRKTSGFFVVETNTSADQCGDEPLQIKQKFPTAFVAVDENRVKGVKKILSQKSVDVVILDDAFQHRKIKCGLNILLTEYDNLFCNDELLPAGRLRESKKGYLRADIVIVTKTPEYATPIDLKGVMKEVNTRPYQNLFFSYLKYGHPYNLFDKKETINIPMHLFNCSVLLVTGIANPKPILTYVKEYAEGVVHKAFNDHHHFSIQDITEIKDAYNQLENENKIIITTEKDATRLISFVDELKEVSIFVLPVEIDFKTKREEFNNQIIKYARANKIHHSKYS